MEDVKDRIVEYIAVKKLRTERGIQEDKERNARTLVNRLSPTVFDPNAYTPEFKGFLVKIEKA